MTRFFYIVLVMLILVSCSGNNPMRYIKPVENDSYYPFIIEYATLPHDSFPLHYPVESDASVDSKEYSYSVIKDYGDTLVWEEGVIRE